MYSKLYTVIQLGTYFEASLLLFKRKLTNYQLHEIYRALSADIKPEVSCQVL